MATELNLTAARNSLWDAIDNYPGTSGAFAQTIRFNKEESLVQEMGKPPSISDFPAIMIKPASCSPEWWTHEMANWPVVYDVHIWTQDWALPEGETLIEKVLEAFWRATPPDSTVTYVKQATGYYPYKLAPFRWAMVGDGSQYQPRATEITATVALRLQKDPFQAS